MDRNCSASATRSCCNRTERKENESVAASELDRTIKRLRRVGHVHVRRSARQATAGQRADAAGERIYEAVIFDNVRRRRVRRQLVELSGQRRLYLHVVVVAMVAMRRQRFENVGRLREWSIAAEAALWMCVHRHHVCRCSALMIDPLTWLRSARSNEDW